MYPGTHLESYCIQCHATSAAELAEVDGRMVLQVRCPRHSSDAVKVWDDAGHFRKTCSYGATPADKRAQQHGEGCFCLQCARNPILILVEVTRRCNLNCPVCFRAKGVAGTSNRGESDPDAAELLQRLKRLRELRPEIDPTIAFTGGEPTLRDDLPMLIRETHRLGFSRTEVITNGIRLAEDVSYLQALKAAKLSQLGFQFDGFDDAAYVKLRGTSLLETKRKALQNIKNVGQATILAVCVANGINTGEVGAILEYAIDNKDFVEHVNFQTLVLTLDNSRSFSVENKVDLRSLTSLIEEQTRGRIRRDDFYPPVRIHPLPELLEALTGGSQTQSFPFFHPLCNLATYVHVDRNKNLVSINEALRVDEFLEYLERMAGILRDKGGTLSRARVAFLLTARMFGFIRSPIFRRIAWKSMFKKTFDPLANLQENLLISCADYMDYLTYRRDRTDRCGLFFLTGDDRAIPFCAYNLFARDSVDQRRSEGCET